MKTFEQFWNSCPEYHDLGSKNFAKFFWLAGMRGYGSLITPITRTKPQIAGWYTAQRNDENDTFTIVEVVEIQGELVGTDLLCCETHAVTPLDDDFWDGYLWASKRVMEIE